MPARAVVVVDGEHYPPVVAAALSRLRADHELVAGVFAGGGEKLREAAAGTAALARRLGLSRLEHVDLRGARPAPALEAVRRLLREAHAEVLVDLSDEPVVGYRERFLLMSAALAEGCRYVAADTEVRPQLVPRLGTAPVLAVIGTGKRVGKTAVSGWLARRLDGRLRGHGGVVVLAMGRGGPARPELVDGRRPLDAAALLEVSRAGGHAASDCYEDAVLAGVRAVGCRRCGGGLAGAPADDTVARALPLLRDSGAALVVAEGSGAVVPPLAPDAVLCVSGAGQPREYVAGLLGTWRLLLADGLVLTQCEAPFTTPEAVAALVEAVHAVRPGLEVVTTVFRPRPTAPLAGRRVAFFTTAPATTLPLLRRHLEEAHGAEVVAASADLADRGRLAAAVARAAEAADVFLTEIKAAAVDVVAEAAAAHGKELVFCDNEPVVVDGDLGALVDRLADLAGAPFTAPEPLLPLRAPEPAGGGALP